MHILIKIILAPTLFSFLCATKDIFASQSNNLRSALIKSHDETTNRQLRNNYWQFRQKHENRVKQLIEEQATLIQDKQILTDHEHVATYCHCRHHSASSKLTENRKQLEECGRQLQLTPYGLHILMNDHKEHRAEESKNNN